MEFSSFPKNLAYAVKTLSGFSKSTVKLLPDNRVSTVQSGDVIRVRLPQNSLVDLRTFTMYYDGSTETSGATSLAHFPRLSSSVIETLTIFVNGTQIENIQNLFGYEYSEILGKIHFWITFVGVNLIFFPTTFFRISRNASTIC